MAVLRFQALQEVSRRQPVAVEYPSNKISDYYGINVFDLPKMEKYLSKDAFRSVQKAIEAGTRIDSKMADEVAAAMKAWAACVEGNEKPSGSGISRRASGIDVKGLGIIAKFFNRFNFFFDFTKQRSHFFCP